jgi:hypothetical protein
LATLDVTKKLHIYHTLYRLNLSFANIVRHCHTLQEAGIFKPKFSRLYQELQAEINEDSLSILHDVELEDLGRFGKARTAREKELGDPNDVFIHAEERSKQLRKKAPSKK